MAHQRTHNAHMLNNNPDLRARAHTQGEKPIQGFFESLGLEEKETLNGVAVAGQCQFSCLADQLFGR
jgi:hypothetical protein